ncbi:hypothetical protein TNCV_1700481 [Trichonephila clavipes]|nr:hypothetical protein TNCV_1700481 [Trichonephila clavipes]
MTNDALVSERVRKDNRQTLLENVVRGHPFIVSGFSSTSVNWYLLYDNAPAHRFVLSDEVKAASQEALREVAKNGFQLYFQKLCER